MKTILVIDDDELILMTCRNLLKKEGFEVLEAKNGNFGIDLYKNKNPDLVITDLLMPEKDGVSLMTEAQTLAASTPILAISGGGATGKPEEFLEYACYYADEVLPKPFSKDEFLSCIDRVASNALVKQLLY